MGGEVWTQYMIQVRPDLTKARAIQFGSTPATQLHHVNQDINGKSRGRYVHVCLYIVYISNMRGREGGTEGGRGWGATRSVICPHLRYYRNTNCFCHLLLQVVSAEPSRSREQLGISKDANYMSWKNARLPQSSIS